MSVPFSAQPFPHLLLLVLLILAILKGVRWYPIVVFLCISEIASEVEHFFHIFLGHLHVFLEKCLVRSASRY